MLNLLDGSFEVRLVDLSYESKTKQSVFVYLLVLYPQKILVAHRTYTVLKLSSCKKYPFPNEGQVPSAPPPHTLSICARSNNMNFTPASKRKHAILYITRVFPFQYLYHSRLLFWTFILKCNCLFYATIFLKIPVFIYKCFVTFNSCIQ